MSPSKYHSRKTLVDNILFDSLHEAAGYQELKVRLQAGEIADLELQPAYVIMVNGHTICTYRADFRYYDRRLGKQVVLDRKGYRTREYKLKKKLVEAQYGIEITES